MQWGFMTYKVDVNIIQDSKLRSLLSKMGAGQKMTGKEVTAEVDRIRARRKAEKEQKIREKYESQKRREAEEEWEPKRQEIRK